MRTPHIGSGIVLLAERTPGSIVSRYPLVWRLWISRFLTANADGIGQFSIQWLATTFPNPAFALGYANTFGSIGSILSSYIFGWLSDNFSPAVLMVSGNIIGAAFTVFIGFMLRSHQSILLLFLPLRINVFFYLLSHSHDYAPWQFERDCQNARCANFQTGTPLQEQKLALFYQYMEHKYVRTFGCPHIPLRFTLPCHTGSMPSHSFVLPLKGWMPFLAP